jgi:hypothetical protein
MELDDLFAKNEPPEAKSEKVTPAQSGAVVAISTALMAHIKPLLSPTAFIERVNDDAQFGNAVNLSKVTKQCLDELDKEDGAVCDPMYKAWKDAKEVYKPARVSLTAFYKNLNNVTAEYQLRKREEAEKAERLEREKREADAKRLADEADAKIREEEALRREAEKQVAAAALETDPDKKSEIEQSANAAAAKAELAIQEAMAKSQAALEVQAAPVFRPAAPAATGFTATYKFTARITDEKAALKWLLEKGEWGFLKGAALTKLIQAACDKTAKLKESEFKMDGAVLVKTPDAKVNAYKPDDSRIKGTPVEQSSGPAEYYANKGSGGFTGD